MLIMTENTLNICIPTQPTEEGRAGRMSAPNGTKITLSISPDHSPRVE